jgi:hypothetical protein
MQSCGVLVRQMSGKATNRELTAMLPCSLGTDGANHTCKSIHSEYESSSLRVWNCGRTAEFIFALCTCADRRCKGLVSEHLGIYWRACSRMGNFHRTFAHRSSEHACE